MQEEIRLSYKSIQNKDFYYILCEAEFKYNNRNKTQIELINEFFECYNLVYYFDNCGIEKDLKVTTLIKKCPDFLYNENLNALFDESSDDD